MLARRMWLRATLAVAMLVVIAARGPILAQTEGEEDHGLEEPDLGEPGPEDDERGTAPDDAPQDHGYHHRYDFDGGADDELPTEPASEPALQHEAPAQGAPTEPAPSAPASPPAGAPVDEAPASAPAEL